MGCHFILNSKWSVNKHSSPHLGVYPGICREGMREASKNLTSVAVPCRYSNRGHFIKFSVITNIYNKKTKGPTLIELFTVTRKLKRFF
jgi:hypothetical protein